MTTLDSIRELASLLHSIRASWDITATCNALLPHRDMPLETLAAAAIRCAQDQNNRTPAALGWMTLAPAGSAESKEAPQTSKEPTCFICARTRSQCRKAHDYEVAHGLPDSHIFETHEEADANRSDYQVNDRESDRALVPLGAALDKVAEQSPERAEAKARARTAVEAARQKSKWKPAPPPDERRIQQPEETPA